MTRQECVEQLQHARFLILAQDKDWLDARDIPMLDMAIEALEKQIPKKPEHTIIQYLCKGEELKMKHPECPSCRNNGKTVWDAAIPKDQDYCHRCGQAIDWSEYENQATSD